jgi:hypothetical protein
MRRREFITVLGGAAATWPLAVRAQQQRDRVRRIGVLIPFREDAETLVLVAAFRQPKNSVGPRIAMFSLTIAIQMEIQNAPALRARSWSRRLLTRSSPTPTLRYRP